MSKANLTFVEKDNQGNGAKIHVSDVCTKKEGVGTAICSTVRKPHRDIWSSLALGRFVSISPFLLHFI